MCRVLSYAGTPLLLEELLYKPDVAFVQQTHQSVLLQRLNLAGSGILAWDAGSRRPSLPYVHRTTQLAIYDRNLWALAQKIVATNVLAHLRGVAYHHGAIISEQNLHPFLFDGTRIALAHNGQLGRFDELKADLMAAIAPKWAAQIRGSTDSEWIYALFLSHLDEVCARTDPEATTAPQGNPSLDAIEEALVASLQTLTALRNQRGIRGFSPMNLFLSDGEDLIAVCHTFDLDHVPEESADFHRPDEEVLKIWVCTGERFGLHDDRWTMLPSDGAPRCAIIASEPLSRAHDGWTAVPLGHIVRARREHEYVNVDVKPLPPLER